MTRHSRHPRCAFRLPRRGDERGSMAMLMMVTLVGLMLSALVVPMIVTQDRTTRFNITRVHALDAAQAGIDAMLGRIRAATAAGIGDSADLPCDPMTGQVTGNSQAAYAVTVEYFTADPVQPTAPKMICAPGYGTFESVSGAFTPSYARLTSVGTDGPAVNGSSDGRTLVTTYVFKTTNTNIPGGVIRIYPASGSSTPMCIDAGSTTPTANTAVKLQSCSTTTPPVAQQVFVYRADLTIQLLSSVTPTYLNGLCLDTATGVAGNPILLKACQVIGSAPYTQLWSFNDSGAYQAALLTSKTTGTLANVCMNAAAQTAGQGLTLATCVGDTSSPTQAWIPAPSVGAGAAAAPQWINYFEFGRCMDITGQDVNASHLIDYPCKQNPYAGAVAWNQKFTPPTIPTGGVSATGHFTTSSPSGSYCLSTPGTIGGYVTVKACSTSTLQNWTVYNGGTALTYAKKFTIVDNGGRCLGLTVPVSGEQWSAIDVETCTGASEQKWNANPDLSTPALQNTREN